MMQNDGQLELSLGPARAPRRRAGKSASIASWRDGAALPYQGRTLALRLDGAIGHVELAGDTLCLPLPPAADDGQIRDRAEGWLQGEARRLLGEHVRRVAASLGLPAPVWQISLASGVRIEVDRGGCLRLPWRLVQLTPEEIDRRLLRLLMPLRQRTNLLEIWDGQALPA
mgnify:CR=1 FL=1